MSTAEELNMSAAEKLNLISVDDYLDGELVSPIKHEYVGGVVHAMSGARAAHNLIAGNIFAALHGRLQGKKCGPFNSDMKIRIRLPTHVRFYYPDVSVICHSYGPTDPYQDDPTILIEVLSRRTRRVDAGEKKDAYLTIPSLAAYLLVEQESAKVTVFRRTDQGFEPEVYQGLDAVVPLPEIETELPLAAAYDRVEFVPEPDEQE